MKKIILLVSICLSFVACSGDDGGAPPEKIPEVLTPVAVLLNQEKADFEALVEGLDTEIYDGEEKFFQLVQWWNDIKDLEIMFESATVGSLTSEDKDLLTSMIKSEIQSRNLVIILNKLPIHRLTLAGYVNTSIVDTINNIESDYESLTQEQLGASATLAITLNSIEQVLEFYTGSTECDNSGKFAEIVLSEALTDETCEAKDLEYLQPLVSFMSINGKCIRGSAGPTDRPMVNLCQGFVIKNDTLEDNGANDSLEQLRNTNLISLYGDSNDCDEFELAIRVLTPITGLVCADENFIYESLHHYIKSKKVGSQCTPDIDTLYYVDVCLDGVVQ